MFVEGETLIILPLLPETDAGSMSSTDAHHFGKGRTEEDALFDRQVRLWGVAGQRRLKKAHVYCFGATAVTSETLKNLVLPSTFH